MSSFFNITVASLPGYDELVAEIYINGRFIALLSQEAGPEKTEIEFANSKVGTTLQLSLATFEKALFEARRQLFELRKTDTSSSDEHG
jgi:hypothetical protein